MPVFLGGENAFSRLLKYRVCLTVFNFLNTYVFLSEKASEIVYKKKSITMMVLTIT